MKHWIFALLITLASDALHAENNQSTPQTTPKVIENNTTDPKQLAKHVKEQMKLEEHYARTQSFAQGKDYNLSIHKVDPKDLESIYVDPPEYDFNMDDVYD